LARDEIKLKLLYELIKGSRRSDRELSKILGHTRATIARKRKELEREGLIKEYTIIPDFAKLGYQICAFTFLTWAQKPRPEDIERGKEWLAEHPEIIMAAGGEGFATNIIVSMHRDYSEFSSFMAHLRTCLQPIFYSPQFFIVNLSGESIYKNFSFRTLTNNRADKKSWYTVIQQKYGVLSKKLEPENNYKIRV